MGITDDRNGVARNDGGAWRGACQGGWWIGAVVLLAASACNPDSVVTPPVGDDGSVVQQPPDFGAWQPVDFAGTVTEDGGGASRGDLTQAPLESTCTRCHGTADDPAPPRDVQGHTETRYRGVGAHASHLLASPWHKQIACAECHIIPTKPTWDPMVPTHLDGINELTWGPIAQAGVFNGNTCAGSYCHGATLFADAIGDPVTNRTPLWTTVNGTQASCGKSCHGLPPGGKHPPHVGNCALCHSAVIKDFQAGDPPTVTWANANLHINGKVDVIDLNGASCTTCHGDPKTNNPMPPRGTKGETLTTDPAVGAHATHIAPSAWHRQGLCTDCHLLPQIMLHANAKVDFDWSGPAIARGATPTFDLNNVTCGDVYCHGASLLGPKQGGMIMRQPLWTKVDGTQAVCGQTCHTTPPGGIHPQVVQGCPLCHGEVIATFTPGNPPTATWVDARRHIDGNLDVKLECTSCHGDVKANDPAPPRGTKGEMLPSDPAVGAHAQHLGKSNWHRDGQCRDCHAVPGVMLHSDGAIDFAWGSPANAGGASPAFDTQKLTCSGAYCHGVTLPGPTPGGAVSRTPVWNKVDGSFDACGTTCHTNPPAGNHPQVNGQGRCEQCHGDVITSFVAGNPPQVLWANAQRHIDGNIDVKALACTSCHGDVNTQSPAPPVGTHGETLTSQAAVGAHTQHLGPSNWHRAGQCVDCHAVPNDFGHSNGTIDFAWGAPAGVDGANPAFDAKGLTCGNVYCHGVTLRGANQGGMVNRTPVWNVVDGTYDQCGTTCHTLPPGGGHPQNNACPMCHTAVIKALVLGNPVQVTWADASLHIDGKIDVQGLSCTTCHGDALTNNPAPPKGTRGETLTSQPAVGAHAQHLGASSWHRPGQCTDCHVVPAVNNHFNGVIDFGWTAPANANNTKPAFDGVALTCSGTWCHGTALLGPNQGGVVSRTPVWNKVDGSFDDCGTTCHTNPPAAPHPQSTTCAQCHKDVIASYDSVARTATWAAPALHIDGKVESSAYHDLAGWTQPRLGKDHHGSNYFLTKQQKDEHGVNCTQCHGAKLDGGTSGVSCFNANCHPTLDACTFCHGDSKQNLANPPRGVRDEAATSTLAVGRHVAHLNASSTHTAIACAICHTVPPAGNLAHALEYVPTADLLSAGHHGDVAFSAGAVGMAWNVAGTSGNPVSARGTCLGKCHSNGAGGNPVVTPYWAGGAWTAGSCGNCHAANPQTGRHGDHRGNNITCATCHPGANANSHLDGTVQVTTPVEGVLNIVLRGGACGQRPTCTGTCHGGGHTNRCW